jgi:HD-like signal output (HDOD) protein
MSVAGTRLETRVPPWRSDVAVLPNTPGAAVGQPITAQSLQQTLVAIFQDPRYRPPMLPRIALQLTSLTRKASVSYDEVVGVIQQDPMLAAAVLKVAQSPVYGGRRPAQSLKDALQRMGLSRLRDIVWQVTLGTRLFKTGALAAFTEQLQAHNLFVAHSARLVAERAGIPSEEAFLCGLLHDVGFSAIVSALADTGAPPPPLSTLIEAMDTIHEQAGSHVATLWKLSPEVVSVIQNHHRFNAHAPGVSPLTGVICVAEHVAHELGHAILGTRNSEAERAFDQQALATFEAALRRLNLAREYKALLEACKALGASLAV